MNFLYSFFKQCNDPPSNTIFWRLLHFIFTIITSQIGRQIYKIIKKQYPTFTITIFQHISIGDILLLNKYYNSFCNAYSLNTSSTITIFTDKVEKIAKLFEFSNPVFVPTYKMIALSQFASHNKTEIISLNKWNIFDMEGLIIEPIFSIPKTLCCDYIFPELENCIILSPYEKSVSYQNANNLSMDFWDNLAFKIKEMGYRVLTNCPNTKSEPAVKGTIPIFPKYSEIISCCKLCKMVIALRSGFCDFASFAGDISMIVLYPNPEWKEYYSIQKLWNIKCDEISFKDKKEDLLINNIINLIERS